MERASRSAAAETQPPVLTMLQPAAPLGLNCERVFPRAYALGYFLALLRS